MCKRSHAAVGFAALSIPILVYLLERSRHREEPHKKKENPAASSAIDKKKKKPPGVRTPVANAEDVDGCIELLRTAGLVRINSVLDRRTSESLRAVCSALVDAGLSAVASGQVAATDLLAPHLLKGNQYGHRHDVKLSLDSDEVRSALGAALAVLGPLLTAVVSVPHQY